MRLMRAQVRDYRSVHDSGVIEVEKDKTLLVGVNEAGKTAVLRAIQQINPPPGTEPLSPLRDYPRSRYTEVQRGDRDPSDMVVAEAAFSLAEADKAAVRSAAPDLGDIDEFVLFRYLDNARKFNFGSAVVGNLFRCRQGSRPAAGLLGQPGWGRRGCGGAGRVD